jgi:hypothetical protein
MKKIFLKPAKHHNKKLLSIQFGYNDNIKNHLKKLENIYWSRSLSSFYTELSLESIKIVFNHLKIKNYSVYFLELQNYIEESKKKQFKILIW